MKIANSGQEVLNIWYDLSQSFAYSQAHLRYFNNFAITSILFTSEAIIWIWLILNDNELLVKC